MWKIAKQTAAVLTERLHNKPQLCWLKDCTTNCNCADGTISQNVATQPCRRRVEISVVQDVQEACWDKRCANGQVNLPYQHLCLSRPLKVRLLQLSRNLESLSIYHYNKVHYMWTVNGISWEYYTHASLYGAICCSCYLLQFLRYFKRYLCVVVLKSPVRTHR